MVHIRLHFSTIDTGIVPPWQQGSHFIVKDMCVKCHSQEMTACFMLASFACCLPVTCCLTGPLGTRLLRRGQGLTSQPLCHNQSNRSAWQWALVLSCKMLMPWHGIPHLWQCIVCHNISSVTHWCLAVTVSPVKQIHKKHALAVPKQFPWSSWLCCFDKVCFGFSISWMVGCRCCMINPCFIPCNSTQQAALLMFITCQMHETQPHIIGFMIVRYCSNA